MPERDFDAVMDTNLMGAVRVTQAVLPDMVVGRWGRLIYVSSVTALAGAPGQANYAASKAGLIGFARSVAREVGRREITANVVTPGLIETDMAAGVTDKRRDVAAGTDRVPPRRHRHGGRGGRPVPGERGRRVHHRDVAAGHRRRRHRPRSHP